MAQAYITTFTNDYRWPDLQKTASCEPRDAYAERVPDGNIWLIKEDNLKDTQNIAAAKEIVNRMTRKRLWSTYQVHYCKDQMSEDSSTVDKSFENELLAYCNKLFAPKTVKLLPPLSTTRRILGYLKPKLMYVPITNYQEDYGKVGYNVLKENYDRISKLPESAWKLKCK